MVVSVAIQAHPARAELAEALAACPCLDGRAEIVYDPAPGSPSAWRTYREALERTPDGATHRLILQDDVLVCDGFAAAVDAAVAARPDRVICFFVAGHPVVHSTAIHDAAHRGDRWIELTNRTWIPTVGTLWPADRIVPLLEWVDRQTWPVTFTADDEICGRFLHAHGEWALATVPSLVEHPDTVPSLIRPRPTGGLDPGRRAAVWIADLGFCDASTLDWT